jgi:hypothetical protein
VVATAVRLAGVGGASLIGEGRVYRPIARQAETQIFSHAGAAPGYLDHFYVIDSCQYWQGMRLRYYIDGSTVADIDVDLAIAHSIGWFVTAAANGTECSSQGCAARCTTGGEPWQSDLFGKTSENGLWNNFKVPFSTSVRVTLQLPVDAAVAEASLYTGVRGAVGAELATEALAVGDLLLPLAQKPRLHVDKFVGVELAPMTSFDIFASNRSGALLLTTLVVASPTRGFMGSCFRAYLGGNNTRSPNDFDVLLGTGTEE